MNDMTLRCKVIYACKKGRRLIYEYHSNAALSFIAGEGCSIPQQEMITVVDAVVHGI